MKKVFLLAPFVLVMAASLIYIFKSPRSTSAQAPLPIGWNTFVYTQEDACNPSNPAEGLRVKADLDGDSVQDEAMLLKNIESKKLALFVYLSSQKQYEKIKDFETTSEIVLSVLKPGEIQTACGKGYFECTGEPKILKMDNPTLDVVYCEKSDFALVWNATTKKFSEVWLSD
jgi:hypothetical protein